MKREMRESGGERVEIRERERGKKNRKIER